jgi:hypothetical protein
LPLLAAAVLGDAGAASAEVAPPAGDVAGAQDHPLLARDPGALIVEQAVADPGRAVLPASPLEPTDPTGAGGGRVLAARDTRELAGRVVRTAYLAAAGRSPLDVHRGYLDLVGALGGEVLHACTSHACGGDVSGGAGRDAGLAGIITELHPPGLPAVAAGDDSPAGCALRSKHRHQRYLLARLPLAGDEGAHAAVLTYAVDAKAAGAGCAAFVDRAVAIVMVVEPQAGGGAPVEAAPASVEDPQEPTAAGLPATDVVTGRDGGPTRPPATAEAAPGAPLEEAVRVFIHHTAADALQAVRAGLLADELTREGFAVADIRTVSYKIGSARVRYFFREDLDGARRILRAAGPLMADGTGEAAPRDPDDFTHYEPKPYPGTVEVWLPGG